MILNELKLTKFRNYETLSLFLNPHLNIFIGKNGVGKTNILESIYFLGITKTYRLIEEKNLIKKNELFCKVEGTIKKQKLKIVLNEKEKKVYLGKIEIKKLSDYISNLNIVIFSHDSLDIITSSPQIRRKFLNISLAQISKKYLLKLNQYNLILKTRNSYLKSIKNSGLNQQYLNIITEKLIEIAIYIYQFRNNFINDLNNNISFYYKKIVNENDILYLKYLPNIELKDFTNEEIKKELLKIYHLNQRKEILNGFTLYGPHRDDFIFYLNNENIYFYGSGGQQKTAIIALKLSEVDVFIKNTGEEPVLLLDDIFSEFDKFKKNNLLKLIKDNIQVIITTPDLNNIYKKNIKNATIFHVNEGIIIKKEEV